MATAAARRARKNILQGTREVARPVNGKLMNGREVTTGSVGWTPVVMKVMSGRGNVIPMLIVQLHDQLSAPKVPGSEIPPDLVSYCPRCGNNWQIRGDARGISVEYLKHPKLIDLPLPSGGVKRIMQTAVVSVEGECGCPWEDDSGGKGVCGYRFRITDNVVSPV